MQNNFLNQNNWKNILMTSICKVSCNVTSVEKRTPSLSLVYKNNSNLPWNQFMKIKFITRLS